MYIEMRERNIIYLFCISLYSVFEIAHSLPLDINYEGQEHIVKVMDNESLGGSLGNSL